MLTLKQRLKINSLNKWRTNNQFCLITLDAIDVVIESNIAKSLYDNATIIWI